MKPSDIACFITNARKSSSKLSHKIQKDLENWNRADFMLYQHFNSTLWNKIEEIGISKVQSEVKELQELVSNLTDKCVAGYFENKDLPPEFQVYKQPGVKVLGIKVRFRHYTLKWALRNQIVWSVDVKAVGPIEKSTVDVHLLKYI